jgi:multidrug transporter EmrE-like cation transporter
MTGTAFALLFAGVLLNAAAQLFLKAGTNATGVVTLTADDWLGTLARLATVPPIVAGIACYAVSVVIWILGLSRVPVSIAYPMLSLGYVVNALAAQWLFGEAVTLQRWIGIGFILLGVWLVARSA